MFCEICFSVRTKFDEPFYIKFLNRENTVDENFYLIFKPDNNVKLNENLKVVVVNSIKVVF